MLCFLNGTGRKLHSLFPSLPAVRAPHFHTNSLLLGGRMVFVWSKPPSTLCARIAAHWKYEAALGADHEVWCHACDCVCACSLLLDS